MSTERVVVLVLVIIVLLLLWEEMRKSARDGERRVQVFRDGERRVQVFRDGERRIEGYRSCCWKGCGTECDGQDIKSSLAMNPFRWPYSGSPCVEADPAKAPVSAGSAEGFDNGPPPCFMRESKYTSGQQMNDPMASVSDHDELTA